MIMRKLRCCVIDDEPLALELIKSYVEKTPFLEFVDALDIQMAELNGIEFARVVPARCRIVFITAFPQYAVEGFRANALDYLLKPVSYTEFLEAANKAMMWFKLVENSENVGNEQKHIIVKSEYKLLQIPIDDITYIEGLKDYVRIFLDNGTSVMSLMSLRTMELGLPSSRFMRVHRSFIVQTSKIKVIERNRIVFGKQYIPISDTYKSEFMDYVARNSLTNVKEES